MTITNEFIGSRIKATRQEQGYTQSHLAEILERTVGAISQLEQGKVQITAIDLYTIAKFLHKRLEFFFEEEDREEEIDNIVALARRDSEQGRINSAKLMFRLMKIYSLGDTLAKQKDPPTEEQVETFLKNFIPTVQTINSLTNQLNDVWKALSTDLEIEGVDVKAMIESLEENPPEDL